MSPTPVTEIGKDFFLYRSDEEEFHRNILIKSFENDASDRINMICDPGTKLDLARLIPLLKETIGGIERIGIIFLSHQDPDLTANTSMVMSSAPRSMLITSVDTWRLVKMYGLPEKRVRTVESFNSQTIHLKKTGHRIRFVPATFCHFRGAMMVYDPESRVLFSGDFLGGINTRKGDGVYADEASWAGIELFHQLYMPSRRAVEQTVDRISLLNPFPEVIAPQHGDIIKGDLVVEFLSRLRSLNVGMDLLSENDPDREVAILAVNNFLSYIRDEHPDISKQMEKEFQKDNKFTSPFLWSSGAVVDIKVSAIAAITQIWQFIDVLTRESDMVTHLKGVFRDVLNQFDIRTPFGNDDDQDDELAFDAIMSSLE